MFFASSQGGLETLEYPIILSSILRLSLTTKAAATAGKKRQILNQQGIEAMSSRVNIYSSKMNLQHPQADTTSFCVYCLIIDILNRIFFFQRDYVFKIYQC